MEIVLLVNRKLIHSNSTGTGVFSSGGKFTRVGCTASFREVKNSGIDLSVYCTVNYLWLVVWFFCFLGYFLDDIVKGIQLALDLPLDL